MEEMEWLGWLCAFMLILHGLRVVQTPLRGGCKTQPHHLLVTNHFASLQGLRDELRPWGETGGNSRGRVGAGGGMLGGEGSCPSTQSQKSLSQVWRSVEGEPSLPSSGEALCFQVPSGAFGSFSPHVLIPLGCCGRPSPGSRLRILGGGGRRPHPATPPLHCHLPSPSFADRHGWGRWSGGCHQWVCHPGISTWPDRTPSDRRLLPAVIPLLPPQASLLFQPCHQLSAVTSPCLHPHLHPLEDLELPGLNVVHLPTAFLLAGPLPSLSLLVSHCPFDHIWGEPCS